MSKRFWIFFAMALILTGVLLFGGAMNTMGWDFARISTSKYETNSHVVTENFQDISIAGKEADIHFILTDERDCRVVCYEESVARHTVVVENGELVIRVADERKWYHHIGIRFSSPKITVYLPRENYGTLFVEGNTGDVSIPGDFRFESMQITVDTGDVRSGAAVEGVLKVKTSTGDIRLDNLSAKEISASVSTGNVRMTDIRCGEALAIRVSTGKTTLTDVACKRLESEGNTGDLTMKDVIATERFSIERSTGDIKMENCDASEITIETDTGDVRGSLRSSKIFVVKTDTGDVQVPESVTGGKCKITTDTGDIRITTP